MSAHCVLILGRCRMCYVSPAHRQAMCLAPAHGGSGPDHCWSVPIGRWSKAAAAGSVGTSVVTAMAKLGVQGIKPLVEFH